MSAIHRPMVANIYNPQNQTKEQLIDGFVVRQQLFKKLFKAIKEAKMEVPEQHYLILGRRGMGKTTLLLRLAYEIENDPVLNDWLIPLVFNEEEYGIYHLFKFWERVMELLEDKHPNFRFEPAEIKRLSRENPDHDAYEKALFEWLTAELKRTGKKLILFVDNFGDMARKLDDTEAHRLRKILQTSADIRIFAASSVVLEAFYKYDHPFYEFFKQVELEGLNEKETRELLLALGRHYKKDEVRRIVEENPGRVEALRRITGGVIRSVVLLFEIFADDQDGSAFHDLQIILDRVSPLYKHRMDDLSDQQQAIVEAIALNWDAISVKEITEQTRLESKVISAQLNNLEKNGIVEKRATRTKNHLYLISERFFNIWFLMRLGRKADQKRVLWLVRFFEEWCDKDLIKDRAERHIEALRKGRFDPEGAFYITQAMAGVRDLDHVSRHKLLSATKSYLSEIDMELAQSLSQSDLDLACQAVEKWYEGAREESIRLLKTVKPFSNSKINDLLTATTILPNFTEIEERVAQKWQDTMNDFACDIAWICYNDLQMKSLAQKYLENSATTGFPRGMNGIGVLYEIEHKEIKKAEEWYLKAAEKGSVGAMSNLGVLYQDEYYDLKKAEEWYLKAAEKGDSDAMFNLGCFYQDELRDVQKTEEWWMKAAKKGDPRAMNNLASLYKNEYKDLQRAEEWYLKAIKKGHLGAMNNLALLYKNERNDFQKAEEWYLKAAEKGYSNAMNNLACFFQNERNDFQKAEEWYLKAAEKGHSGAMNNLALLYKNEHKDLQKAEEWHLEAAEKGDADAMYWLGRLYEGEYKNFQKAEEWYQKATEKDDLDAMFNLGCLYRDELKDIQKAEEYWLKAAEKGDSDTMTQLAWLYQDELKDIQKAAEWWRKAAGKGDSLAMVSLGCLYQDEYKDIQKAEEWWQKAADSGSVQGLNHLAWHLFEEKKEKSRALELAANAHQKEPGEPYNAHTYACILLWHNRIGESLEITPNFLWNKGLQEKEKDDFILFFTLLLAKNQAQTLYDIFTSPQGEEHNFKDRFKPIWYAILKKLDHPDFLRMGNDLQQTVEEVLARAEQLAEEYK